MKLRNKIKLYYSILEEAIWERSEKNKIFIFLSWLISIPYRIGFKYNRCICYLFGCIEKGGYGGFNLPDGAYSYWCERCFAGNSNYEGDTNYPMLEGIFKGRKKW